MSTIITISNWPDPISCSFSHYEVTGENAMRKMLSIVTAFCILFPMNAAAQPVMLQEDAARTETLRKKVLESPLQSFIKVRTLNRENYWGHLIEAADTDCSVRILLRNGVEDRKFSYSQLRSANVEEPPPPNNPDTLSVRERVFRVPEGSLVEVRFRKEKNLSGVIDDIRAEQFSLRFRMANEFSIRDINFSDVKSISVKSKALSRAISDPSVWDLIARPKNNPLPADAETSLTLKDGTAVALRLLHAVSSAGALSEDRVEFLVAAEVKVGNQVAIPIGSLAWGHVTKVANRRRMGRGGHVDIALEEVLLKNGIGAPLRAVRQAAGGGSASVVVGTAVLVAVLFGVPLASLALLHRGSDTTIPKGTMIVAYINGDTAFDGK
jgi:hypothetical protein